MVGNREYEKRRLIQFGACVLKTILVFISAFIFMASPSSRPELMFYIGNSGFIFMYLFIGIGIEFIGFLGVYYEKTCFTITYICIDIVQIICACTLLSWWIALFYLVSLFTSIRFLSSLYDELVRQQFNHLYILYNVSPGAFSGVLQVQSPFRPLPGQSFVQTLPEKCSADQLSDNPPVQPNPEKSNDQEPLPLHHNSSILQLTNDPSSSQVINVTEMTTSGPAEPAPPTYEDTKPDSS